MQLSQEQIDSLARRACWYVRVDNTRDPNFGGDVYTIPGDGVDDLNSLLSLMPTQPKAQYSIDVGLQYGDYRPCDAEDIAGIKLAYIQAYGTTDKPPLTIPEGRALEL